MTDPCRSADIKEYSVKRLLRGVEFDITVKNPDGKQRGVKSIIVDGKPIEGNIVKATSGKHVVEVVM